MNMINKEPERHEIEALLPWHAAGTLSRRDADRVEQALASDRELRRRYDIVREELAETIHLNETLGAPSARAMEKLFAAIDAEEARAPRRQRSFDLAGRVSEFLSRLFAAHARLVGDRGCACDCRAGGGHHRGHGREGRAGQLRGREHQEPTARSRSCASSRRRARATSPISSVPTRRRWSTDRSPAASTASGFPRAPLPRDEVGKIVKRMQDESKIVGFIAVAE